MALRASDIPSRGDGVRSEDGTDHSRIRREGALLRRADGASTGELLSMLDEVLRADPAFQVEFALQGRDGTVASIIGRRLVRDPVSRPLCREMVDGLDGDGVEFDQRIRRRLEWHEREDGVEEALDRHEARMGF